jgi:phosphoribosylamine--glycine ligase
VSTADKQDRILIVGSGAREHAIALALSRSASQPSLFCFGSARNPGIESLTTAYATGSLTDVSSIVDFAVQNQSNLAIIGPEAPLAAGAADALWAASIPTVGPTQSLARIESSKGFTRDLLAEHNIPGNPVFRRFTSIDGVEETLTAMPSHVIKDDGLAGGKGVKVFGDHLHSKQDSLTFCRALVELGHPFVIEEKLEGEEFSFIFFCDGHTQLGTPLVQDHKRAFAGDTGPNTGGMGSYSAADHSLPFLTASDVREARNITHLVAQALETECGAPYQGLLYGGFIATSEGVRLIEYNARFGDPECLNILTLLETDFVQICLAIVDRTLADLDITFAPLASVCKYIVPEGYPDAPRKGDLVALPTTLSPNVHLFLGAVDLVDDKLTSTGSRTMAAVATAATLAEAEALCEQIIASIAGPYFHRADIGTAELIDKRIAHMRSLRPA